MISIDFEAQVVIVEEGEDRRVVPLASPEAFAAASRAWLRCGWDVKHAYTFSWLGRPIIQLPEDMVRAQEAIYNVKPDLIIETGIAHGGSLIFYASLCKAMGCGRVVGIDVDIRPHNRTAIESHELFEYITLYEGSSTDPAVIEKIAAEANQAGTVMVFLDSNHTKAHVLAELAAYAPLVSVGSYIVAADGIMEQLVGAPRSSPDWGTDNPRQAAIEFTAENPNFMISQPDFTFNEGQVSGPVTYWPDGWIRRVS